MPDVKLDDMLAVAAEIRLVSTADQANRPNMLQKLPEPDRTIMLDLAKRTDPPATLKDFILARAAEKPTQTVEEIIAALSSKRLGDIDKDHLLINLIHAHITQQKIEAYDISTLMRLYVTLTTVASVDPSLESLQFVDCLAPGKPDAMVELNAAFAAAVQGSNMLSEQKSKGLSYMRLKQPKYPILQQALERKYSLFNDPLMGVQLGGDLLSIKNEGMNMTGYTAPLPILAGLYEKTCDQNDHCMLPLPMFGCFSFEILRKYSCRLDGEQEYRPVTMGTYLPTAIKQLFYGARENSVKEVVYDLYNSDPDSKKHFYDMMWAHQTLARIFGVMNHDEFHIREANKEDRAEAEVRHALIDSLEQCLQQGSKSDNLHEMVQGLLDTGVNAVITKTLQGSNTELPERLRMFELILSKISQPEVKTSLVDAICKWSRCREGGIAQLDKEYPGLGDILNKWLDAKPRLRM